MANNTKPNEQQEENLAFDFFEDEVETPEVPEEEGKSEEETENASEASEEVEETTEESSRPAEEKASTKETPAEEVDPEGTIETEDGQKMVPLSVLLQERSVSKARLEEARKSREQASPQTQEQPKEFTPPDPKEDPEGYAQYVEEVQQLNVLNERLNHSEDIARLKHGDELVDEAYNWWAEASKNDKALVQTVLSHRSPYAKAVELYQQRQKVEQVEQLGDLTPDEIAQFKAWKAAQTGQPQDGAKPKPEAKPAPAAAAKPPSGGKTPAKPPSSIANEEEAPQEVADLGGGTAFDNAFGD